MNIGDTSLQAPTSSMSFRLPGLLGGMPEVDNATHLPVLPAVADTGTLK